MVQNGFTQSMLDLGQNMFGQGTNSSKRLISPLRSLDLTMLNQNNLTNMSFLIPGKQAEKRDRSKKKVKSNLMISPTQIKRNRVHSVRVPTQKSANVLTQSMNRLRNHSRDASIAEVNEDLYRDSVESQHEDDIEDSDDNQINKKSIILPLRNNNNGRMQYCDLKADDELSRVLLQDKPRNEIYYDSLENETSDIEQQETFFQQTNRSKGVPSCRIQPRQILQENKNPMQKKSLKKNDKYINEDDDCLVNILDQEDTHIELQPTMMHTRQHLSTEHLFREINNTIETLQSFRNLKQQIQKQNANVANIQKIANPLPKPYQTFQKAAVQKMLKLQESHQKFEQFKTNTSSQKPNAHYGDNLMKSPSSPNLFPNQQQQRNLQKQQSTSSNKNSKLLRLDSCPSPLDENETVLMLGSGEKLRIKEVSQSKMDQYSNQFKEQRHKFAATIKPPQSNKNQNQVSQQQEFGFRTRTNSLINSTCSEICLKMKFMPSSDNIPNNQIINKASYHSRIPSQMGPQKTNQSLMSKNISPRGYKQ